MKKAYTSPNTNKKSWVAPKLTKHKKTSFIKSGGGIKGVENASYSLS